MSLPVTAQDTTSHGRVTWNYFKVIFDDDYLNIAGKGTDRYYTGGWQVDGCYKRNNSATPLTDRLLLRLPGANNLYFYGINRKIYTPYDLESASIVENDRPYASVFTIQHGLFSTKPETNESLITEAGIGAIGPITYGAQIQKWFHRMIGDEIPQGWDNQVSNDVVIDYKLYYERRVVSLSDYLKVLANVDCEAGTLVDNMGLGVTVGFGKFNSTFVRDNLQIQNSEKKSNKFLVHIYMHPTVRVVVYNATLEGGIFSENAYTISRNNINNIYLQYDMGVVFVYKRVGFSFSQKTRTAEFRNGLVQEIGSITITVPLTSK